MAAGSATTGAVSASVLALTERVLKSMFLTKVKTLAAVVLACFLAVGGVLVGHALAFPVPTPAVPVAAEDQPDAGKDQKKARPKEEEEAKKKEATNVPAIKQIVVQGNGNVIFQQGGKQTLKGATADDVKDGVLHLTGDVDVIVDLKELPEILLQGSGNFTGKGIQAKKAVFVIQGSGKIDLSGTADEQVITVQGSGPFDGRKLKGKQGTVNIGGNGEVFVNVTDTLKANVAGSGSVHYLGSPKVEESTFGGGTVRAYKEGDGPAIKLPAKVVPDPRLERLRELEAELKKLQEELKKKNP